MTTGDDWYRSELFIDKQTRQQKEIVNIRGGEGDDGNEGRGKNERAQSRR
jgi:hypothetical protein